MTHLQDTSDPRTFSIIGAGMEVQRVLGPGFLENVIRGAVAVEFELRRIPFMTEVPFPVVYKGRQLPGFYRADFVCYESIIVEIKVGSSEGGVQGNLGSHHPERSGVIRTFSPFGHLHTAEVIQELNQPQVMLTAQVFQPIPGTRKALRLVGDVTQMAQLFPTGILGV